MPVYLVHCEFEDAARNIPEIDSALESLELCIRPFPGTWLVEAPLSAYQIETLLEPQLRPNDRLLIVRIAEEGSWRNVSAEAHAYMDATFKRNRYGSAPP